MQRESSGGRAWAFALVALVVLAAMLPTYLAARVVEARGHQAQPTEQGDLEACSLLGDVSEGDWDDVAYDGATTDAPRVASPARPSQQLVLLGRSRLTPAANGPFWKARAPPAQTL